MYATLAVLALFVLTATFLLEPTNQDVQPTEATSDSSDDITSIHDLLLSPEAYRDTLVTTEGILRKGDSDTEFLVVDSDNQGIIVRDDIDTLAALEDQAIQVTGRFGFTLGTGVYIDAVSLTALED
jgi:hypothetical protein